MSGKDKKKSKERGLNVRVKKDEKTRQEAVWVNSYFEKNRKKSPKKAESDAKITEKDIKTVENEVKNTEKFAKIESKITEKTIKNGATSTEEVIGNSTKNAKKSEEYVKNAKNEVKFTESNQKNTENERKNVKNEVKITSKSDYEHRRTANSDGNEILLDNREKEVKKPASFSKAKKAGDKPTIILPEKKRENRTENIIIPEPNNDIITPERDNIENATTPTGDNKKDAKKERITRKESGQKEAAQKEVEAEFETLSLRDTLEESISRIVLRDVEREVPLKPLKAEQDVAYGFSRHNHAENHTKKATVAPRVTECQQQEAATTPRAVERQQQVRPETSKKLTAKEIKEQEIEKAIKVAARLPEQKSTRRRRNSFMTPRWTRMVLAVACAATAVFAITYLINTTSADMSLKVAAMQSGIEAVYPSYIPRGYTLSDVTSATGMVTMNFKTDEGAFTLSEENTTWDSNALLNNYIREYYDDSEYTVVREQGLTLYMGDRWEAWVNGGMLYKLKVTAGSLTKKQLKTIATSL